MRHRPGEFSFNLGFVWGGVGSVRQVSLPLSATMSSLNPKAMPFVLPPKMPAPASPSNRSSRQKNGRQKSGGGDRQKSGGNQGNNQLPKKVYMVDAVNVTGLNYSPTGALYSSASKAYLERNNYSPTGALYSPWARNVARLATELIPSKREAIIKQVEFYFGDSNFPKDKFLQKEVKKKADGYVSLKVIAAFTKLKKLTTSWRVVAKAIECSGVVELNVARNSVRRRYPLPDPKTNPTWNRTVVVENLPRNASIVDIGTRFGVAGKVEHVRLIDNKKVPDDIAAYMDVIKNPHGALRRGKVCTLVEFASVGEAQTACDMLTDETNWRNGLRVTLLLPKKADFVKAPKQGSDESAVQSSTNSNGVDESSQPTEAEEKSASTASADRKARGLEKLYAEHPELASVGSGSTRKSRPRGATGAVMPPGVLRMPTHPDGTRGFAGAGRGKPVTF